MVIIKETPNDLLQGVPLSLTTGHSSQTQNVGDVRNTGIEVELDATVVKAGDFEFDIYGNVSTNENEVLKLAQTADGEDINLDGTWTATRVGRPIYEYYLRQFGGVRPDTGNAFWYVGGDGVDSPVSFEETESYNAAYKLFQEPEFQQQLEHLDLDLNSKVYLLIPTLHTLEVIKFMSNGLVTLCTRSVIYTILSGFN